MSKVLPHVGATPGSEAIIHHGDLPESDNVGDVLALRKGSSSATAILDTDTDVKFRRCRSEEAQFRKQANRKHDSREAHNFYAKEHRFHVEKDSHHMHHEDSHQLFTAELLLAKVDMLEKEGGSAEELHQTKHEYIEHIEAVRLNRKHLVKEDKQSADSHHHAPEAYGGRRASVSVAQTVARDAHIHAKTHAHAKEDLATKLARAEELASRDIKPKRRVHMMPLVISVGALMRSNKRSRSWRMPWRRTSVVR